MDPENTAPAESPAPAGRKSGWAFFGILLLIAPAGVLAQASSRLWGLAWTEVFALLTPALVVAAGSNLRPGRYLRLGRLRPGPVALGALAGAAGFLLAGAIMALTMQLLPESWVRTFDVSRLLGEPGWRRWALAALVSLLAPACEEIAFRGYLLTTFALSRPPARAIVLAALLFAAIHLDPVRFPALLALGVVYGWLAWRAGSVWPAVAAHGVNNAVASLLLVLGGDPEPTPAAPGMASAAGMLALGLAALLPVLAAYRATTPEPPGAETALALRDPAQPSIRFSLARVPSGYVLLWLAGAASLGALLVGAARG